MPLLKMGGTTNKMSYPSQLKKHARWGRGNKPAHYGSPYSRFVRSRQQRPPLNLDHAPTMGQSSSTAADVPSEEHFSEAPMLSEPEEGEITNERDCEMQVSPEDEIEEVSPHLATLFSRTTPARKRAALALIPDPTCTEDPKVVLKRMRAAVDDQPYFPGQSPKRSKPLFDPPPGTSASEKKRRPPPAAQPVKVQPPSSPTVPSSSPPSIVDDTPPEPTSQGVPPIVVQSPSPLSKDATVDGTSASYASQGDDSSLVEGVPLLPSCTDAQPYGFWEQLALRAGLSTPDFTRKPDFPFKCLMPGMPLLSEIYDSVPLVRPKWPKPEVGEQVGIEWRLGLDYNDCLAEGEEPAKYPTNSSGATPSSMLRDQLSTLGLGGLDTSPLGRNCGGGEAESLFEEMMSMDFGALKESRSRNTRRSTAVHPTIAEYGSSSSSPPPPFGDDGMRDRRESYRETLRTSKLDVDDEVAWNLFNASVERGGDRDSLDNLELTPELTQVSEPKVDNNGLHGSPQPEAEERGLDPSEELMSIEDNRVDPNLYQQMALLKDVRMDQRPWRFWVYSSQDDPSFGTDRRHRSVDPAAWSVFMTFNFSLVERYIYMREHVGYNGLSSLDKARWTEEMAPMVLGQEEPPAATSSLLSQERDVLLDLDALSSSDAGWRWSMSKSDASPEAAEILVRTPTPEHEGFLGKSPLSWPGSDSGSTHFLPPSAMSFYSATPIKAGPVCTAGANEEHQFEPAEAHDMRMLDSDHES